MSGDRNAPSNDETEEDLVCLPDEEPLAVAPEPSPLGVRNTSVCESESVFSGNSFPLLLIETGVKRTSFSQILRSGIYLRPKWSRTIRPGDKGPPSAKGTRFGVYLRLEWSRNNNHNITTLICLHSDRTLP